jgi:predicted secreted protein
MEMARRSQGERHARAIHEVTCDHIQITFEEMAQGSDLTDVVFRDIQLIHAASKSV